METIEKQQPVVFTKGKRKQDIGKDVALLLSKGETAECAFNVVAYKYYTTADEVWEVWLEKQHDFRRENANAYSMRASRTEGVLREFNYLLAMKLYTVEVISKMVALKFGMEVNSAYQLWYNQTKNALPALPA